jgi:DNA-binding NarL/FixJ family response regulator
LRAAEKALAWGAFMRFEKVRVIVAEDDESFLETVVAVLADDGRFEVVGRARNGEDAVELAERLAVDAVVMDIEMPVRDGIEATRLLHERAPHVPVVAISGRDYEERVFEILEAGAVDYVRKSRIEEELVSVLEALVAVHDRR